jgi:hypothetical protein
MARQDTSSPLQTRYGLCLQARGHWFEPSCAHQSFRGWMTILETLIGESRAIAGNHRCTPSDVAGAPGGQGCIPSAPGVRRAVAGTPSLELRGRCRVRGVRRGWCTPALLRALVADMRPRRPGDLAGRKTGWVFNEGRLPGRRHSGPVAEPHPDTLRRAVILGRPTASKEAQKTHSAVHNVPGHVS